MNGQEKMSWRIRDKRTESGLSMQELGDKLGVKRQSVYKWEHGDVANIKREHIAKMARIFECSPVWLMGLDTPADPIEVEDVPTGDETENAISRLSAYKALINAVGNVKPENYDAALKMLRSLS